MYFGRSVADCLLILVMDRCCLSCMCILKDPVFVLLVFFPDTVVVLLPS